MRRERWRVDRGTALYWAAMLVWAGSGMFCVPATRGETFFDLFPARAGRKAPIVKEKDQSNGEVLFQEETEEEKLIDAFVMRQVKFASDWNPDPTAIPQFTYQFRKALRMRCRMVDEPLVLSDPEIFRWPVLYMTAHNSFRLTEEERKGLKEYLTRGGLLIADDCSAGGGGFVPSFRSEIARLFPGQAFEYVSPDDKRFAKLFSSAYHFNKTIKMVSDFDNEVLFLDGRVAIFLIADDYGCGWEVRVPPSSANPLGEGLHFPNEKRKECFEFCFNIILYLLTH